MTGYLHPEYARSLSEFGEPVPLPESGGWLLKRVIDRFADDAMGTYPIFACSDWNALAHDLQGLGSLVSALVVTDPFGKYDEALLQECFPDLLIPFKSHFVYDLALSPEIAVCEHHARNARIGLQQVSVERCADPSRYLDEWVHLYSVLIKRHQIGGIRAFSSDSFAIQFDTPGMVCFRALRARQTVGMILWYLQNGIAYYHLGAYADEGYRLRASFALFRTALDYFASSGLRYVNLGAGTGLGSAADDGLSRFKRGWSNGVRTAYLGGRIFDHERYDDLVRRRGVGVTDYFPAYRKGEFN